MSSSRSSGSSRNQKRGSKSSSKTKSSLNTSVSQRSKNSLPKDANYHQKLVDGGIFPYGYKYPDGQRIPLPPGWDHLNQRLAQSRPSLSPSNIPEDEYQKFVDADAEARDEAAVKNPVLPMMMQAMHASDTAQQDKLFANMDPMTDGIARAKPDYYYGARHEQIHPKVQSEVGKYIFPSLDGSPAVPNFSMEAKGPERSGAEALRQACHNGAIGARAMHSLHTYGEQQPIYDNHIRTISSTYHLGTLKMYGHSVSQPNGPNSRPEYHMHQLKTWGMTSDRETFLRGATAFKNAKDLTTEYRQAAINHANSIANRARHDPTVQAKFTTTFAMVREHSKGDEDSENNESDNDDSVDEKEEQEEDDDDDDDVDDDDDDDDDDEDGSETSVEEEQFRHPPSKRSSKQSHSSHRHRPHHSHNSGHSSSRGRSGPTGKSCSSRLR